LQFKRKTRSQEEVRGSEEEDRRSGIKPVKKKKKKNADLFSVQRFTRKLSRESFVRISEIQRGKPLKSLFIFQLSIA
jgi:hypothetical protein